LEEEFEGTKSDAARAKAGRGFVIGRDCWACTEAAACLSKDEAEIDRWSMTSDMLLFFRMGFFAIKDGAFERFRGEGTGEQ